MVNRKQKGNRMEREVKKIHEDRGWSVHKVRNLPYKHGDMFGCADLVCMCRQKVKFIAVTSKANKSRAVKALKSFKNHPASLVKEAWLYTYTDKRNTIWEVVDV